MTGRPKVPAGLVVQGWWWRARAWRRVALVVVAVVAALAALGAVAQPRPRPCARLAVVAGRTHLTYLTYGACAPGQVQRLDVP